MASVNISIGCGSWTDREYTGVLYPKGLAAGDKLAHYAKIFSHIEVNSTYHAMPPLERVKAWVRQTPGDFIFDIKLHKGLSQKPAHYRELTALTLRHCQPLIDTGKLGTFLLLLSPYFVPERNRLEELDGIIDALRPHGLAIELRNRKWVEGEERVRTLAYFKKQKVAWVTVDMPDVDKPGVMPAVDEVTLPKMAYLRLHGRNREGYLHGKTAEESHDYFYSTAELGEIAVRIKKLAAQAESVRVVANNHCKDYAPRTAIQLKRLLGQDLPAMEEQPGLF